MNFFHQAGQLFAGFGMLVSSFLGAHSAVLGQSIAPSIQNVSTDDYYKINKSVTYDGYSVAVAIDVPKNGGKIDGSLSGDCTGTISGNYAGGNNGAISGQMDGSCQALFLQIPIHSTFSGTVDTDTKTAQLSVTIRVDSLEKTEPVTVRFN